MSGAWGSGPSEEKAAVKRAVSDRIEDLEFMDENGTTATEAAQRAGFPTPGAMEKWLERHDAYDLWLSFKKREAPGVHSKEARRDAPRPDGIASLISEAQKSSRKRTRNKADRLSDLVGELRTILRAEKEQEAAESEARAEIERLERELAKAREKLRGGATSASVRTVRNGPPAAEVRAWAAKHNVACPAVGRVPAAVIEAFENGTRPGKPSPTPDADA